MGFILDETGSGWLGGANYFQNLLKVLGVSDVVEPVVLTSGSPPAAIVRQNPGLRLVRTPLVAQGGGLYVTRRAVGRVLDHDIALDSFLRFKGIQVLSHSGHLGRRARTRTIGWIPDFQHRRLPHFFSSEERRSRDLGFTRLGRACTRVIVSSNVAAEDFREFLPAFAGKVRTLRFAAGLGFAPDAAPPKVEILAKYGLAPEYIHLPNQFWVHKNHRVVVEAVGLARAQGRPLQVVATGSTSDNRFAAHFASLQERIAQLDIAGDFRTLGVVPYSDVVGLMRHAVAVLNPSLFEGWSSSVEEAKSMGKRVILSDIPVHREQAPEPADFFPPDEPEALLAHMFEATRSFDPAVDLRRQWQAWEAAPQRLNEFRGAYEAIAVEAAQD